MTRASKIQLLSVKRFDYERTLANVGVEGSNPFARSRQSATK
jgi:hypothetical protein